MHNWAIYARGNHLNVEPNVPKYGINPLFVPVVEEWLNQDAPPTFIVKKCKELQREDLKYHHCLIPTTTQISNHRSTMRSTHSGVFQFEQISKIEEYARRFLWKREEFERLGEKEAVQITLGVSSCDVTDTMTGKLVKQYGFTYTTKAQLLDCRSYLDHSKRLQLGRVLNIDLLFV